MRSTLALRPCLVDIGQLASEETMTFLLNPQGYFINQKSRTFNLNASGNVGEITNRSGGNAQWDDFTSVSR